MKAMNSYKDIDTYIKNFPKDVREQLKILRSLIQVVAPDAEETIKYGIPTFVYHGNLVHFGGYTTHVGFYPGATAIKIFKEELSKYKTSKGAVQFPLGSPLPKMLIQKIVKYRVKENSSKKS